MLVAGQEMVLNSLKVNRRQLNGIEDGSKDSTPRKRRKDNADVDCLSAIGEAVK